MAGVAATIAEIIDARVHKLGEAMEQKIATHTIEPWKLPRRRSRWDSLMWNCARPARSPVYVGANRSVPWANQRLLTARDPGSVNTTQTLRDHDEKANRAILLLVFH